VSDSESGDGFAGGNTIGPYCLVRELGSGGMGIVYLAHDPRLDRNVALKLLPPFVSADPDAKRRFVEEAKAASALDHPNIGTIYEIDETDDGRSYIAMAYYEGETLRDKLARGPLPIDEALDVARQVATGLGAAHERGIVHRDIKPANVIITPEGVAKIVDFGVAKVAGGSDLTRTGTTVGTVAYMSPEQANSRPVDHRTDLWSLGVVLYEMLAGERPFLGAQDALVIYSILHEDPDPLSEHRPDIPAAVQAAAHKLLQRDPAARYQSATDFLTAGETPWGDARAGEEPAGATPPATDPLSGSAGRFMKARRGWAVLPILAIVGYGVSRALVPSAPDSTVADGGLGAAAEPQRIVVLPFENLGPVEDVYFAAGMTDEITSRLGAASGLGVISRRAALRYEGTDKSNSEIGEELGVGYILSGSVYWAEGGSGRVRITPELVRVSDDAQLWSEPYERVIEDIYELQSDIAGQVIDRLGVTLLEDERTALDARPTENVEAYTLYLKGRHFWNKRTEEDIRLALGYFQEAVDLDPAYALAHVGIADVWIFRGWYSRLAPMETFPRAKQAVTNALQFDETLAEAHTSRAHIALEFDHDWEAAERGYLRAIELDPSYPIARHWYGGYLSAMGRHGEALAQAERARELDPLSLIINTWVGLRHYFARRYDVAIEEYENALELGPEFAPGHWHYGWALEQAGRYEEAIWRRRPRGDTCRPTTLP
jgi:serine/threonine-protein kinase